MKSILFITRTLLVAMFSVIIASVFKVNPYYTFFVVSLFAILMPSQKNVLGMNSNMDMRMVFENAKAALAKAFNHPPTEDMTAYFKMTQSSIQLEQPIIAGATIYTFPVFNNQGATTTTERRLKQQDSSVIYQIFVGLATPAAADDASWFPFTYPNQVAFGANAQAQYALYQGVMQMTINGDQALINWDLNRHLYQPETQQTAALGAASPNDQTRGSFDGYYPMEPNVTLIGSKDNDIKIFLPQGGITAATTFSRIVIKMRTILAQNSTVVS